jgi:hypothetical protein
MSKIKQILKKILFYILYKDKNVYYKDNYNSLNFLHLFFWNFFRPGRAIEKIKYRRILFPKKLKNLDNNIYISNQDYSNGKIEDVCSEKLKKYGTVLLNEYFSEQTLLEFEEEYKKDFEDIDKPPSNNYNKSDYLHFSNILSKLWFDEGIIKSLEKYNNGIPYARNYAQLGSVKPLSNSKAKSNNYADSWHLDHSTLIQVAIFFNDIGEKDSHMQTLVGSNTYPAVTNPGNLSKEYVEKNNLKIGKCVGKRGSVQIHCGNTFHRFKPFPNSTRKWIKFVFSSGNNIQLDTNNIAKMLKNDFNLDTLDKKSRKILSGLFPYKLHKGYELKNKGFYPTKFKGI